MWAQQCCYENAQRAAKMNAFNGATSTGTHTTVQPAEWPDAPRMTSRCWWTKPDSH